MGEKKPEAEASGFFMEQSKLAVFRWQLAVKTADSDFLPTACFVLELHSYPDTDQIRVGGVVPVVSGRTINLIT